MKPLFALHLNGIFSRARFRKLKPLVFTSGFVMQVTYALLIITAYYKWQ